MLVLLLRSQAVVSQLAGRSWSEHRNKPGDGTVARGNVVFGSAADAALVGLGDNFEFGIQTS